MSQDVRMAIDYWVNDSQGRRSCLYYGYKADRGETGLVVNTGVYANVVDSPDYSYKWRLGWFRNNDVVFYTLQALDTASGTIPDNADAATYWKHAPWYLCHMNNQVLLSPVGETGSGTIDQNAAYWIQNQYVDANGVSYARLEPVNYRGAVLSPNLTSGYPDQTRPVGIRDGVPSTAGNCLNIYYRDVPAAVPA